MSFAFDAGAGGGSAITGGVRPVVGYLVVNGAIIPVLQAECQQTANNQSGHFNATVAVDALPAGADEDYFANTSPIQAAIAVSTQAGGQPTTLIQGSIDTTDFDAETRLFHVNGNDATAPLHRQKSSEKFLNQQPQDIITTVAQRVGLTAAADSLGLFAGKIMQIDFAKMTEDISLGSIVHKMTEFMGANWYLDPATQVMHVRLASSASSGGYTITYSPGPPISGNFLTMRITRKVPLSGNVAVTVKGWHTKRKQVIQSTKTMSGQGSGTLTYQYHVPNVEQDHADQHAAAKLANHTRHELSVSVECVGDETIDISKPLILSGTKYDQSYDIDTINHVIGDRGYTMMIQAKSAKSGRSTS